MGELPNFDSEWNYAQPAETEKRFRQILAEHEHAPVDFRAQLMTQIARCRGLQRQFDDAHRRLDEVENLLDADTSQPLVIARMRYLLERGRVHNSGGNAPASIPFFTQAYQLGRKHPERKFPGIDFHTIDAAHMLAIVETPEKQEEWALRALEFARQTINERARGWCGALTNNLAWTYHEQQRYEDALKLFQENLEFWLRKKRPRNENIAQWSIARTLRSLERVDEALKIQQRLLSSWRQEDGGPSGYVFEELGECCLLLGREDEARIHFATAYEMLSEDDWLQANEKARLDRLAKLGGRDQ